MTTELFAKTEAAIAVRLGENPGNVPLSEIADLEKLAGTDPGALCKVGRAYLEAGAANDARRVLERADVRQASADYFADLSEARMRTMDVPGAFSAAQEAKRLSGINMRTLQVLCPPAVCARNGQAVQEAFSALKLRSAEEAEGLIRFWSSRLEELRYFGQAALIFKMLFDMRTPRYEDLVEYAQLQLKAYAPREAQEAIDRAIELNPDAPEAYLAATRLKIQQGEMDEALALARRALDADRTSAGAYVFISEIDAGALTDVDVENMRRLVDASSGELQAKLCFALGAAMEKRRIFDTAFKYYEQANRRIEAANARKGFSYLKEQTEERLARLKAVFTKAFYERIPAPSADSSPLVFVLGMPRSGTTLIEQILTGHPKIGGVGELSAMARIDQEFHKLCEDKSAFQNDQALAAKLAEWASAYVQGVRKRQPDAACIVDKLPLNFWRIGLIRALFPKAKIIYAKRDAVEVCFSIYRLHFPHTFSFASDFDNLAHYYGQHEAMMAYWTKVAPGGFLTVRYRDLISDTQGAARRMIEYCGMPWDDACLDFTSNEKSVFTLSAAQVRRDVYEDALDRTAAYGKLLEPLRRAVAKHTAG